MVKVDISMDNKPLATRECEAVLFITVNDEKKLDDGTIDRDMTRSLIGEASESSVLAMVEGAMRVAEDAFPGFKDKLFTMLLLNNISDFMKSREDDGDDKATMENGTVCAEI